MKRFKLLIMHPGMSRFNDTVLAESYKITDGSIIFYNTVVNGVITSQVTQSVYPAGLTIITSITEEE